MTAAAQTFEPDYIVAPGEILREAIDDLGMSQADLAKRTGLAPKTVNQIIKGNAPISTETALLLEHVLGTRARFWSNLESAYRERLTKQQRRKALEREIEWLGRFPISELKKRGIIPSSRDKVELLEALLDFFGVGSRSAWEQVWLAPEAALRHSAKVKGSPEALATWLRLGELAAARTYCPDFDKELFKINLGKIRALTKEGPGVFEPKLKQLACDAGVLVCLVPRVKGAPVHGAARWFGRRAIIQLSLRYKTNDQFWFAFFHEAGHILMHGKKRTFLEDGTAQDGLEHEANEFAADLLIPKQFRSDLPSLKSREAIRAFAAKIGVHPGIVVGRLQHEKSIPYSHCNDLKLTLGWRDEAS